MKKKTKQVLHWTHNKTRQRWDTSHDGIKFFIAKMNCKDAPYRLFMNTEPEPHPDGNSYIWEFNYLTSAKKAAWLFVFG